MHLCYQGKEKLLKRLRRGAYRAGGFHARKLVLKGQSKAREYSGAFDRVGAAAVARQGVAVLDGQAAIFLSRPRCFSIAETRTSSWRISFRTNRSFLSPDDLHRSGLVGVFYLRSNFHGLLISYRTQALCILASFLGSQVVCLKLF